jgi:hypothetical protein
VPAMLVKAQPENLAGLRRYAWPCAARCGW